MNAVQVVPVVYNNITYLAEVVDQGYLVRELGKILPFGSVTVKSDAA